MSLRPRHRPARARTPETTPAEPRDAYALGLALVARREWSVRQLRERLRAEGCDPAGVEAAIERLCQERTLDDARVAAAFARTSAHVKHRGRLRILRELALMGVDDEIARTAVDEVLPEDEAAGALDAAIARRLRPPVDERQVRRVFGALVRQGFPPGDVRRALRRRARVDLAGDTDE